MRRWLTMVVVLGACAAILFYAQRHKTETHVGPEAMLNALADTQREISRLPAGLARLSDRDEVRVGDAMAQKYEVRTGVLGAAEAEVEDYVNAVGHSVAARGRRKLEYKFHYIPDSVLVNPFPLPAGHLLIRKRLPFLFPNSDDLTSALS